MIFWQLITTFVIAYIVMHVLGRTIIQWVTVGVSDNFKLAMFWVGVAAVGGIALIVVMMLTFSLQLSNG